jgi:hypothetical protein
METLLQSWLSTHTGHSGPRRHALTTTGSRDGGKAVHNYSECLTGLDVTNPFFASLLSMDSMVDGRVWLVALSPEAVDPVRAFLLFQIVDHQTETLLPSRGAFEELITLRSNPRSL